MVRGNSRIGHVLAPWPFLLFGIILIAGAAAACPAFGWVRGSMTAFDTASVVFILLCVPLFRHEARRMRESAQTNDANRGLLLLVAAVVTFVILVSIGSELAQKGRPKSLDIGLVIGTLSLCWVFSTLVYTLHYAHMYYTRGGNGQDEGGLSFPETKEPDYWDFGYFSSCLAMTFQTSDVDITSRTFRRIVIFHTLGAFVFNIGVIAFSINIIGGS
jgi:uncharacterized membrane protein